MTGSAAGAAPRSKAQKILRRTLSGGALVCVVAALLWWTSVSPDGRPIFYAAAVITLAAALETSRMGSLALHDLFPSLALATVGVLALVFASMQAPPASAGLAVESFRATLPLVLGMALVTALAAYALSRVVKRFLRAPVLARLATFAAVGAVILSMQGDLHTTQAGLQRGLLILGGIALLGALLPEPGAFARLSLAGLLAAWLVPALPLLVPFWRDFGTQGLIALLVLSKIGDTCGYYVGSAIGRTHPFPRLSPGKTTAGCVGSFVGATATGGILWATGVLQDGRFGLAGALCAAAVTNLAAQAGDLLESFVKRRAGVKDSSSVFGPSGGLLDQIDSLLVSVPVSVLAWPLVLR